MSAFGGGGGRLVTLGKSFAVNHLSDRLARFKIPTTILLIEAELPRTATGKILKRELRTRYF